MHAGKDFHFSTRISNIFHQMYIFFADINILTSEIIRQREIELSELIVVVVGPISITYRNKLSDIRSVSTAWLSDARITWFLP